MLWETLVQKSQQPNKSARSAPESSSESLSLKRYSSPHNWPTVGQFPYLKSCILQPIVHNYQHRQSWPTSNSSQEFCLGWSGCWRLRAIKVDHDPGSRRCNRRHSLKLIKAVPNLFIQGVNCGQGCLSRTPGARAFLQSFRADAWKSSKFSILLWVNRGSSGSTGE